ncbi:MAG TPA: non-homologous end-joining DNA ligase [Terriglobales bacterium]|nr:non-homologous end-joining DNA ligase [Terriglobales bacterium]
MKAAPLRDYRGKRRWSAPPTPEPRPHLAVVPPPAPAGRRFCVQEHHATRLHYDFRLEINGVLKSWAVPKGPSLDPEVKRLALATEDHPLDYLTFQGHIPQGNYGAGDVIVWDLGDYEPLGDTPPLRQWEQGHLKFRLRGQKLRGEFALTHLPARPSRQQGAEAAEAAASHWLLIKKRDDDAAFGDRAERHPGSVLPHSPATPAARSGPRLVATPTPAYRPMLATLAEKPFSDDRWLFEIKWDGVRACSLCHRGQVQLVSRTGRDITAQYPELAHFPAAPDAELDGEIVVLDAHGASSFPRLQQRLNLADRRALARAARELPVVFYAFDLLRLDGRDLRPLPLAERKRLLAALPWGGPWRYSDHVLGDGAALFQQAAARGLEGIVAKRADSPYQPGRSRLWLKLKAQQRQEAVIVGYTDPQGARTSFGALLLAVYEPEANRFAYIGRVGTGFDTATRAAILRRLRPAPRPALAGAPGRFHPVRPDSVAEVKFAQWTPGGRLRAPVFLGLRTDKPPRECVRERSDAR